jgi:6-phosphogluconolactonase
MDVHVTVETVTGDPDTVVAAVARDFEAEYARATKDHGRMLVAVPGGSVAVHVFPALAELPLDWSRVDFFWVDERAVPASDPESNFALAEALWLHPARVPDERIHRMPADTADLPAAAARYADELDRVLGRSGRFDVVLLGVGPDGHVASLFPGHAALRETRHPVVAIEDAPKPPPRRLTLTLPVLVAAARLVVVAFGESKAQAIARAVTGGDPVSPAGLVLGQSPRPLVAGDRAAMRLTRSG